MASKNKNKADRRPSVAVGGLRQEVERLIAKERLKDAVKQAKLYHRDEPSPESHRLLERAYLLRADELRRNAMPTAAREVAQHLLDFGVTDPDLVEPATKLLLAVGMSRRAQEFAARIESPEARARLALEAADQIVLHPERASEAPPELRAGAATVRQALEAIQAGDEPRAWDALRDVSRSSPFADWKLFARGLAAHQRGDAVEARANWDRLDPERAAARVARAVRAIAGTDPATGPIDLDAVEKQCFGEPVLDLLDQLRTFVTEGNWDDALRRLSPVRIRLRRIDPKLADRLAQVLYDRVVDEASERSEFDALTLGTEFMRASEPLPIDPRWNRFRALIWEGPSGSYEDMEDQWRLYAEDLKTLPILPPEERPLAQALVLAHLGEIYIDIVENVSAPSGPFGPPPGDPRYERERAVACLEESLRIDPRQRDTYVKLLDAYHDWKQPEQALGVARRLLERFPDDLDALMSIAEHHLERDELAQALDYARRARALKPLDERFAQHEWTVRVRFTRRLALEERYDEARAQLDEAERVCPDWSRRPSFTARRVALELKAGQADRAQELLFALQERLAEPAPLWLAVLIESIRYTLPKAERDRFEAHWLTALANKKVRGVTAAELTDVIGPCVAGRVDYPGKDVHVKQVVEYIRRTTRIKYTTVDDLMRVCSFLGLLPEERPLLEKMGARGLKLFPKAPAVLCLAGSFEAEKGPYPVNLAHARQHFQKALEYARLSSDPRETALVPGIQRMLSQLSDMARTLPFARFGRVPMGFQAMLDAMAEELDFESDDFDDDDDDDAPRPSSSHRAAPARPRGGRNPKKG